MSSNKNESVQNEQKVMTKYDLKQQKRQEEKEQAKQVKRREKLVSFIGAAVIVCIIAAFPLTIFFASSNTHITVGGEKISKLEFDYTYNSVKNEYISEVGTAMLQYLGYDISTGLENQQYAEDLTWKDVFEEKAVERLIEKKAMLQEIEKAGFTYDVTAEYEDFKTDIKLGAAEAGTSQGRYVREVLGGYASMKRVESFVKEDILIDAYYDHIQETNAPTEEEINALYESNPVDYESVDYRITMFTANTVAMTDEKEIEETIAKSKADAEEAVKVVMEEGRLIQNRSYEDLNESFAEWMFAEERKEGDTTIIQSEETFYVLGFVRRYLQESGTVDMRLLMYDGDGRALYDQWRNGAATEDSFAELCMNYSGDDSSVKGGLYQNVDVGSWSERINDWLFAEERAYGDTTIFVDEANEEEGTSTLTYILYYVGENEPSWVQKADEAIRTEKLDQYRAEVTANVTMEDPKGKLHYLEVQTSEK